MESIRNCHDPLPAPLLGERKGRQRIATFCKALSINPSSDSSETTREKTREKGGKEGKGKKKENGGKEGEKKEKGEKEGEKKEKGEKPTDGFSEHFSECLHMTDMRDGR